MAEKKEEKIEEKKDISKTEKVKPPETPKTAPEKAVEEKEVEEAPDAPKTAPEENKPEEVQEERKPSEVEIEYPSYEPEPLLDPEPSRHPRSFDPKGLVLGLFITVIIVIGIFVFMEKTKPDIPPITTEEVFANISRIPVMYTFDNYFQNSAYFDGKTITLTGFLKHEQRPVGKTAYMQDYYVVDDYGKKITISFTGMKNPDYFEPLFVKDGQTKDLFNVTGTFRMDNMYVVKLYVTTINPARREYISG